MNDLDTMKIGKELKRLRIEHAYTQEQVADDLGCTVSYVSNVENNRTKFTLRMLSYYAELCNVTVDSILNAGKKGTDANNHTDTCDAELLHVFHLFSKDEQDMIIKTLKYIQSIKH